jgi:hypothetical protein
MVGWHVGMAFALSETAQVAESLLPFCCRDIPGPAGKSFDPVYPNAVEPPVLVMGPLPVHPLTKAVAILHVESRHAGVDFALGEATQVKEPLLP